MPVRDQPSVLSVCVPKVWEKPNRPGCVVSADTTRRAIELLRMLRFDLLLVGLRTPSAAPPWNFVQRARLCWPGQKWMLVGPHDLSTRDEITARSLGATGVIAGHVDWESIAQVARGIRERELARRQLLPDIAPRKGPRVTIDAGAARAALPGNSQRNRSVRNLHLS